MTPITVPVCPKINLISSISGSHIPNSFIASTNPKICEINYVAMGMYLFWRFCRCCSMTRLLIVSTLIVRPSCRACTHSVRGFSSTPAVLHLAIFLATTPQFRTLYGLAGTWWGRPRLRMGFSRVWCMVCASIPAIRICRDSCCWRGVWRRHDWCIVRQGGGVLLVGLHVGEGVGMLGVLRVAPLG